MLDGLASGHTRYDLARSAVEQAPRAGQAMLVHHASKVGGFGGRLQGSAGLHGIQPIDEEHVVAEAAKAEQVLKKHPGVSTGARPARERAGDHCPRDIYHAGHRDKDRRLRGCRPRSSRSLTRRIVMGGPAFGSEVPRRRQLFALLEQRSLH